MQIEIPNVFKDAFVEAKLVPANIHVNTDFKGTDRIHYFYFNVLANRDRIEDVRELLKASDEGTSARRHISAFLKADADPMNARVATFRACQGGLIAWFASLPRGWVYKLQDLPEARLVKNVEYFPGDSDSPAAIYVTLQSVVDGQYSQQSINFGSEDFKGNSLADALANAGWTVENDELNAAYDASIVHYETIKPLFGQQLIITRATKPTRHWSYYDRTEQNEEDLMLSGQGKVVHDRTVARTGYVEPNRRRSRSGRSADEEGNTLEQIRKDLNDLEVPTEPLIMVYHLETHDRVKMHTSALEPYVYDTSIRNKLILPEETMELLDTLTADLDILKEDIVAGKSGGNVIATCGPPGTGKTLTAEVYSEYEQVPLLKVHSGRLGVTPEAIEKALRNVAARAQRWGRCHVLLDECDVFVRQRGNDVIQNAIVAVFLRSLEYLDVTMFLTTNKVDDIDDAIMSRCAAIISYETPGEHQRPVIWRILRDQFLPNMTDEVIDEVSTSLDLMSGRDIKNVLRLAARFEAKGQAIDAHLIRKCATFRGVQVADC